MGADTDTIGPVRVRARVEGVVQGVGFRPFVHGLACSLGLGGSVFNDTTGVVIEVEGPAAAVERFCQGLEARPPPAAVVTRTTVERLPPRGEHGFTIVASDPAGERHAFVSADLATCDDCLQELFDPSDRRYRYPFCNCTNCGPRFTIVRDVPYDRPNTVMDEFAMCDECRREYEDPFDRRFHAQPVCCPACGPSLRLAGSQGHPEDPIAAAAALLREGAVVAVKGLGGYHLAVLASSEEAASRLRGAKHREDKPFAVMVADVAMARSMCEVDDEEAALLASPGRPIVLLRRRDPGRSSPSAVGGLRPPELAPQVARSVAPGNRHLGVMLPYTPLHHLLVREVGEPFVLTSGNVSDEPIAYRDGDALERLAGIADAFLLHDRKIHTRVDDSVTRVVRGRPMVLRRSRGSVPRPLQLPGAVPSAVLSCGAELKSTFCLARGSDAFVSHHIGDLENYETMRSFTDGVTHFERLFDVRPAAVAHDLHPQYLSTAYALERAEREGLPAVAVQHHHAHLASCLADNGTAGPAIGVVFDGTGFGTDGTLWGGEVLVGGTTSFERVGHLEVVPLPGGTAAIREPWRMAAIYLERAYGARAPASIGRRETVDGPGPSGGRFDQVLAMAANGINSPLTSSVGRLFDAVSAAVTGRRRVNYEGQAAVELEQLADPGEQGAYELPIAELVSPTGADGPFTFDGTALFRGAMDDLAAGSDPALVAARFHNGLAAGVVAACERVRASSGLAVVALSGGVFQNMLLLERARSGLEHVGFTVLVHSQVPPNDGGISFGQTAVAATRLDRPLRSVS